MTDHNRSLAAHRLRSVADAIEHGDVLRALMVIAREDRANGISDTLVTQLATLLYQDAAYIAHRLRQAADEQEGKR